MKFILSHQERKTALTLKTFHEEKPLCFPQNHIGAEDFQDTFIRHKVEPDVSEALLCLVGTGRMSGLWGDL